MPQRAGFVEVSLTSWARETRGKNIRKYVCMCRGGFEVYVPGAIYDRLRENCGRELRERTWRRRGRDVGSCAKMRVTRILSVSHAPFRVAGQSDHVFRSRIRIKRILIFAVVQGRRICIREISAVRAYGNLRRAREISRRERTLDCFFPRFPLVTDAVGGSEKKIHRFLRCTNASYFFLFSASRVLFIAIRCLSNSKFYELFTGSIKINVSNDDERCTLMMPSVKKETGYHDL